MSIKKIATRISPKRINGRPVGVKNGEPNRFTNDDRALLAKKTKAERKKKPHG